MLERFNGWHLSEHLPEVPQLATVDVSFISLKLVLPVLYAAGVPAVLALVKPQFEAGRAEADRGRGVIRDPGLHRAVLLEAIRAACESGYCCAGLTIRAGRGPRAIWSFFFTAGLAAGPATPPAPARKIWKPLSMRLWRGHTGAKPGIPGINKAAPRTCDGLRPATAFPRRECCAAS